MRRRFHDLEVHLGPIVKRFQELGDQNCNKKSQGAKLRPLRKLGDQIETFAKVKGPKLQQKKLGDQIETFAKVRGPKLHLSLKRKTRNNIFAHYNNTSL